MTGISKNQGIQHNAIVTEYNLYSDQDSANSNKKALTSENWIKQILRSNQNVLFTKYPNYGSMFLGK